MLCPKPILALPFLPLPGFAGYADPAQDRARLLDSYVAMNVSHRQLSYGNKASGGGPSEGGGMMLSDNADPLTMFRINRVTPISLGPLGEMREEFFVGQYSGYEFMLTPTGLVGQYGQVSRPQPIVHGERFSFKPTPNLEIGSSRTTDYGGPGYPLTLHSFLRSAFHTSQTLPGAANKPGARRSGLDFSYRIPRLLGLTFYADGFTQHDTFSPLVGPDVAAWLGGLYFPRLPETTESRLPRRGSRNTIRRLGGMSDMASFTMMEPGSPALPDRAI